MIKLIQQSDGTYEYVDAATTAPTNSNLSTLNTALDAYEGSTSKSVVDSSVASQTQKVMRETPGQYTTNFDPKTGQFETSSTTGGRQEIAFQEPERTPESTGQTALQKVMSMSSTTGSTQDDGLAKAYKLIEDQQKLAKRAQLTNNLFKGADFALNTYRTIKGDSVLNIANQSNLTTPITQLSRTPIGSSTVGGVGTAGALGYSVSKMLGGDKKENQASGVGSAIGMAVGGPVGGVVGGVIGRVFGGRVICSELYKQKLMTKEDYILDLEFTRTHMLPKYGHAFLRGYWSFAVPAVKLMRKSKWHTNFWKHIACNRAQDIKWRLGKGKFNILGRVYSLFFENLCWAIGSVNKKQVNYHEELYT